MTEDAFLNNADMDVFSFGRPPYSIDIMAEVKGMNFAECYKNSKHIDVEGITVRTIFINDLIKAKKASGRPKDLDDLENLILTIPCRMLVDKLYASNLNRWALFIQTAPYRKCPGE